VRADRRGRRATKTMQRPESVSAVGKSVISQARDSTPTSRPTPLEPGRA
jgi:hypothetical protein